MNNSVKVLQSGNTIPNPEMGNSIFGSNIKCDLCHYDAFNKYLYNNEILYRCKHHNIINLDNLVSKYHY